MKFYIFIFICCVSFLTQVIAIFFLEEKVKDRGCCVPRYRLYRCSNVQIEEQKADGSPSIKTDKNKPDEPPSYEIQCQTIFMPTQKRAIYATANFYTTHYPEFRRGVVSLMLGLYRPRHFGEASKLPELRVGFYPGPFDDPQCMDFPMFEQYGNRNNFNSLVQTIKPLEALIPWHDVPKIAATFNTNVVLKTSIRWDFDYPHYVKVLGLLAPILEKMNVQSAMNPALTATEVERLGKMFLNKMIDPCPLPIPEASRDRINLNTYCQAHCQYLSAVRSGFNLNSFWCGNLKNEGKCVNAACMCFSKFRWRDIPVKMLYCNNEFRFGVQ